MYFLPYWWSQMWRMVISGSWIAKKESDFLYCLDEWRRMVISKAKVIADMVLMIKGGGSFLAIEEEEVHL